MPLKEDYAEFQEKHESLLDQAAQLKREFFQQVHAYLEENLGITGFTKSSWDCETSPTGFCLYDAGADPFQDECLFCGEPEDRK